MNDVGDVLWSNFTALLDHPSSEDGVACGRALLDHMSTELGPDATSMILGLVPLVASAGKPELLRMLLDATNMHVHMLHPSALADAQFVAVCGGNLESIRMLMPDHESVTQMRLVTAAVKGGNVDIVSFVLDRVTEKLDSLDAEARQIEHKDVVAVAWRALASFNVTPGTLAAPVGPIVRLLLERGYWDRGSARLRRVVRDVVYWPLLRKHVRLRHYFYRWLGVVVEASCAPQGIGRQRDEAAFVSAFVE